ncbi:3-isopropylmalate dehydratase [Salinigranum rubrum]|uniref:3-isopropylmalate dehydratase n=1 Tax=Salinigranum rubrum TaxID=755307 RepID=A0A2I8VIZ5_9EURY|nr:PAC2 family protein [Salinigranum rubrum]AUV81891.1 3-isopropylmalate dehydratase [Salinigranum rubrum]
MAHVDVLASVELDAPAMVEGLPGVGLVGKIAADHLVEELGMVHYANVHCETLPKVAVYQQGDATLHPPVRLYADPGTNLLVLQSDVPISPAAAQEFADCIGDWFDDDRVFPIYLSGIGREKSETVPAMYGVGVGDGIERLDAVGIETPSETGLVSGPTGALLNDAVEHGRDAVGLVVESDPRFPDPAAAQVLIRDGIEPLADVDVETDSLVERAEEIRAAKERLAKRMQDAGEESSQARPLGMYQ